MEILIERFRVKYRALKRQQLSEQLSVTDLYGDVEAKSARYRIAVYSSDGKHRLPGETVFSDELGDLYGWSILVDDNWITLPIVHGHPSDVDFFDKPNAIPSVELDVIGYKIKCWRCE